MRARALAVGGAAKDNLIATMTVRKRLSSTRTFLSPLRVVRPLVRLSRRRAEKVEAKEGRSDLRKIDGPYMMRPCKL